MFPLSNPRSEFPCKNKRQDGPGLCDQMLYQSDTRKFASGKGMVLNAEDGRGGLREQPHVCPDRVGSKFHKVEKINMLEYGWHQQHYPCVHCGNIYNKEKMPVCPTCYRLVCRECGNQQNWIVDKGMNCFVCGGMSDCVKVFFHFDRT